MLIVLASCVIDATRSKQVVIPRKKKIVLAHVKKKNSQAVRLKHAAASAFAESLPSIPQLLLPQHPCLKLHNCIPFFDDLIYLVAKKCITLKEVLSIFKVNGLACLCQGGK